MGTDGGVPQEAAWRHAVLAAIAVVREAAWGRTVAFFEEAVSRSVNTNIRQVEYRDQRSRVIATRQAFVIL